MLHPFPGDLLVLLEFNWNKIFPIDKEAPGVAVFEVEVLGLSLFVKGELKGGARLRRRPVNVRSHEI